MQVNHRKFLLGSLLIILLIPVIGTGAAFGFLHSAYLDGHRERLVGLVRSQGSLIEAVAKFDAEFSIKAHPSGPAWATLGQIADAYIRYKGFGTTGELVLGRREGDRIVFISSRATSSGQNAASLSLESEWGEPMRLALQGQSGVIVARDFRGNMVLAAHEPIPSLNAGLVAKMDLTEAREPFLKALVSVGGSLFVVFVVAGIAFHRLSIPLVRHREISESLRKLSHALEQSPLMVFITDHSGRIEYVNPRFTEMTGYTLGEIQGQNPRFLKSGETGSDIYRDLWRTLLSGGVWRGELEDRRKDGSTFWAGVIIAPIKSEQGTIDHFVAIHEDITERKEIERRMAEAMRQTEVANRAKSELLANMSHELRTPLNAIIGFSNMIREQVFGAVGHPKYLEYVQDICASGEHLLALINDILDVSAIEAGKLELAEEPVEFGALAEACLRLVRPRADKGKVSLIHEKRVAQSLWIDPRRTKQILLNLLSNAVKFTPEGGKVTLETGVDSEGFFFRVADTGIGMDAEGVAKAMIPFGQVDSALNRKHEGTGLGLPLTVALVELHGGRLAIGSAPGQGTEITVRLPAERLR